MSGGMKGAWRLGISDGVQRPESRSFHVLSAHT